MKTHTLLVWMALILLCSSCATTKNSKKMPKDHDLYGIWQQIRPVSNNPNSVVHMPFFKVLTKDGFFCNLNVPGMQSSGFFNQEGTFTIQTDSTYTEYVARSSFEPLNNVESPMKYRVFTENGETYMFAQYWFANRWIPEFWKKMKSPRTQTVLRTNQTLF